MTEPGGAALIRKIYDEGFNGGDESIYDECYDPGFVHHSKTIHDISDSVEGEKQSMHRFRAAIPDVRFDIVQLVADGDQVIARLTIKGYAVAEFGTLPPGPVDIHAVAWFRVVEGDGGLRVAEERFFVDSAA